MIKYYGITCGGNEIRQHSTGEHLYNNKIAVSWLQGLNGERSGVTTLNPNTYDNPSSTDVISSGHVSLCINHWFAWQRALDDRCSIAVVFEDDCRVVDGFVKKLESAINHLDKIDRNWEFLYAGHWEGSSHPDFKGHCYDAIDGPVATLKSSPFGTHCYAVKSGSLQGMLNACERIHAPIDVAIWVNAGSFQKQYACVPPLAWQEVDHIDYRNSLSYSKHQDHFRSA